MAESWRAPAPTRTASLKQKTARKKQRRKSKRKRVSTNRAGGARGPRSRSINTERMRGRGTAPGKYSFGSGHRRRVEEYQRIVQFPMFGPSLAATARHL